MDENGLYCVTSWEYRTRHVLFVSFEEETNLFIGALDDVLEKHLPTFVGRLNRYDMRHRIYINLLYRPPLSAFHTKSSTLRRLVPKPIMQLFAMYDYQIVGIWNNGTTTEVYYMSEEPNEEVSFAFSSLSQSFAQD